MLTILNYNESKVNEGVARCIDENGFGCPPEHLPFKQKLYGFENYSQHNRRASATAVHISLNFHPDERLSEPTLKAIALEYMEQIGFASQPYLVYQHFDAGHPHLHIVSTNIQKDGSRIELFRIGKFESEKARKAIEEKFGLVKASGRKESQKDLPEAVRVVYGKSETKRSVSNIVRLVSRSYRFTSLPEFNAALSQFNVVAHQGSERSRMYSKGGLHYRVLNDKGDKVGVPIKASTISGKPTLENLKKQFKLNEVLRRPHKERLVQLIESAFGDRKETTKTSFVKKLNQEGVIVLFRQNDEGRIYGITFVDNNAKVVFNGSDLGKTYSANAITERLSGLTRPEARASEQFKEEAPQTQITSEFGKLLTDLTTAKPHDFSSPESALKMRRKKKRRGRSI